MSNRACQNYIREYMEDNEGTLPLTTLWVEEEKRHEEMTQKRGKALVDLNPNHFLKLPCDLNIDEWELI